MCTSIYSRLLNLSGLNKKYFFFVLRKVNVNHFKFPPFFRKFEIVYFFLLLNIFWLFHKVIRNWVFIIIMMFFVLNLNFKGEGKYVKIYSHLSKFLIECLRIAIDLISITFYEFILYFFLLKILITSYQQTHLFCDNKVYKNCPPY